MEPLSIASAIIGIIAGATGFASTAGSLYSRLRVAPQELNLFHDEIQQFSLVWAMVEPFLHSQNAELSDQAYTMLRNFRRDVTITLIETRSYLEKFVKDNRKSSNRDIFFFAPLSILGCFNRVEENSSSRWKTFLLSNEIRLKREHLQLTRSTIAVLLSVLK
jgi:hypothetical protein